MAVGLAGSGKVPEIDRLGRLAGEAELEDIAGDLVDYGTQGDPAAVSVYVKDKLKELEQ
ncbi:MAG: hypothetical protein GY859_17360 [Desulfobacterales bacterium]|nr:hypothetical protein [Desulfobacterales bacterium]